MSRAEYMKKHFQHQQNQIHLKVSVNQGKTAVQASLKTDSQGHTSQMATDVDTWDSPASVLNLQKLNYLSVVVDDTLFCILKKRSLFYPFLPFLPLLVPLSFPSPPPFLSALRSSVLGDTWDDMHCEQAQAFFTPSAV